MVPNFSRNGQFNLRSLSSFHKKISFLISPKKKDAGRDINDDIRPASTGILLNIKQPSAIFRCNPSRFFSTYAAKGGQFFCHITDVAGSLR